MHFLTGTFQFIFDEDNSTIFKKKLSFYHKNLASSLTSEFCDKMNRLGLPKIGDEYIIIDHCTGKQTWLPDVLCNAREIMS